MADRLPQVTWRPPLWFRRGMVALTVYLAGLGVATSYGFLHQDDQIREACMASTAADKALARELVASIGAELNAPQERVDRVVNDAIHRVEAHHNC